MDCHEEEKRMMWNAYLLRFINLFFTLRQFLKKIFKVDCIPKQNFQQRESLLFNIKCH